MAPARRLATAAASTATFCTGGTLTWREGVRQVLMPTAAASAASTSSSPRNTRLIIEAMRPAVPGSAELLAFGGQLGQQRRRLPELGVVARVLREALHGGGHVVQADLAGVMHRAAAPDREAVAGEVDHVDVAGLAGNAVFQDVRAFVHQRIDQALHDFLVGDLARRDAEFLAVVFDHLVDQLRRDRVALARCVVVPAGAGLLAEAAQL